MLKGVTLCSNTRMFLAAGSAFPAQLDIQAFLSCAGRRLLYVQVPLILPLDRLRACGGSASVRVNTCSVSRSAGSWENPTGLIRYIVLVWSRTTTCI